MIESDDDLRNRLRQWDVPPPGPGLDARVWSAYRQFSQQRIRSRKWLAVAAGIALVAGASRIWLPGRVTPARPQNVSIATIRDAAGFRPLANGTITVVETGEKP